MIACTNSATLSGVVALPVAVETNDGERGDPRIVLVGLPDSAVRESIDRVQSGITSSGFSLPRTHTTINLAPGDLRKEGAAFDLPIALSLLTSTLFKELLYCLKTSSQSLRSNFPVFF